MSWVEDKRWAKLKPRKHTTLTYSTLRGQMCSSVGLVMSASKLVIVLWSCLSQQMRDCVVGPSIYKYVQ
jgi:hypothetical protein